MFKFWRQCELHVKEVVIDECVPQTSGLKKRKVKAIMLIIVTITYPIITRLTNHVKVMYIYLHDYISTEVIHLSVVYFYVLNLD